MTQDSFNILFGMIMVILQIGIINTVPADIRKDTFKTYKDKLVTIYTNVTIQNSESLIQCAAECVTESKCCAAIYSNASMVCHLDISENCSHETTPASGWKTMIRNNLVVPPRDCSQVYKNGSNNVYQFFPNTSDPIGFAVYCELDSDGNGWTVIQRRVDGQTDFYRGWADYEVGFGDIRKEFWLGNEKLYKLTEHNSYTLRIVLEDFKNRTRYAEYQSFKIGNAESKYRLSIDGYSGNAGDILAIHHGMKFSTKDQDNDLWSRDSCARKCLSGWWHKSCHFCNLNGQYLNGKYSTFADVIKWYAWTGYTFLLKSTKMMIRRQ